MGGRGGLILAWLGAAPLPGDGFNIVCSIQPRSAFARTKPTSRALSRAAGPSSQWRLSGVETLGACTLALTDLIAHSATFEHFLLFSMELDKRGITWRAL